MFKLFKKKKDVLDLGKLRKNKISKTSINEETSSDYVDLGNNQQGAETSSLISNEEQGSALGFLGSMAGAGSETNSETSVYSETNIERKRKITEVLKKLTEKQEELSNQIYHLTQRLELLEKKLERGY